MDRKELIKMTAAVLAGNDTRFLLRIDYKEYAKDCVEVAILTLHEIDYQILISTEDEK